MKKKHIICYSGGESSAIVAIIVKQRFPQDEVVLLNHDINPRMEDADIKRFKLEVANYLGLKITYANINGIIEPSKLPNQFDVCIDKGTFVNIHNRQILCTFILKTEPFYDWLNLQDKSNIIVYYGYDSNELDRVERRKTFLNDIGIQSDYPLALWGEGGSIRMKQHILNSIANKKEIDMCKSKQLFDKSEFIRGIDIDSIYKIENYIISDSYIVDMKSTRSVGITPPNTYDVWKHANCRGCLKGGQQHWYCVYVHDYEVYCMGKNAEEIIGHSFMKEYLKDLEPKFKRMKDIGIPANEHISSHAFWKSAKKHLNKEVQDLFPCQCFI